MRFRANLIRVILRDALYNILEELCHAHDSYFETVKRPIFSDIFEEMHTLKRDVLRIRAPNEESGTKNFASDFSRKHLSFEWLSSRELLLSPFALWNTDLPSWLVPEKCKKVMQTVSRESRMSQRNILDAKKCNTCSCTQFMVQLFLLKI